MVDTYFEGLVLMKVADAVRDNVVVESDDSGLGQVLCPLGSGVFADRRVVEGVLFGPSLTLAKTALSGRRDPGDLDMCVERMRHLMREDVELERIFTDREDVCGIPGSCAGKILGLEDDYVLDVFSHAKGHSSEHLYHGCCQLLEV